MGDGGDWAVWRALVCRRAACATPPEAPLLSIGKYDREAERYETRDGKAEATGSYSTGDYHFIKAMGFLIASGPNPEPSRPIVRLGPYTFVHARRAVIFRYVTSDELALIRALSPERVYYLIDDMLPLAQACPERHTTRRIQYDRHHRR